MAGDHPDLQNNKDLRKQIAGRQHAKNIRNDINVIFAKVNGLEQLFAKKGCGDKKFQRITTQQNDYPG